MVSVYFAGSPAYTVADEGLTEIVKLPGAVEPPPVSGTLCGLPGALSAMVSAAKRVPDALGVKMTLMVQLSPAATDEQLFVCEKSAALVPVIVMFVTVKGPAPLLVRVTGDAELGVPTGALGKLRLVGLRLTAGWRIPVPLSGTACGLFGALSVMLIAATRAPAAVGVNDTIIVQGGAPPTIVPAQVFPAMAKSPLFAPVSATLVMVSAALPVLVRLTVCEPLVELMGWSANVRLGGVMVTIGAGKPLPASGTLCGLLAPLSVMVSVP